MSFLDINKARVDGHFGKNPKVWGDDQWSMLISYVSQGMEFAEGDWDSLETRHKSGQRWRKPRKGHHPRQGSTSGV